MRIWPLSLLVALSAGLASVALAAGEASYPLQLDLDDADAAQVAMLRGSDLRPVGGWSGGIEAFDNRGVECPGYRPKISDLVVTGGVQGTWQRDVLLYGGAAVVFKTRQMLVADFKRTLSPKGVACAVGGPTTIVRGAVQTLKLTGFPAPTIGFRANVDITDGGASVPYVVILATTSWKRMQLQTVAFAPRNQRVATEREAVRLLRLMIARARR